MQDNDIVQSGLPGSEPKGGIANEQSARRRLLRGVFAAPAVLTLHSGSAFAMTSVSCLVKANSAPSPTTPLPVDTIAPGDTFIRVRLWKRVRNNQADQFWVKGADLSPYARPGNTPFISSTQWQRFEVGNNRLATGNNQPRGSEPDGIVGQTGPYVVLRIDEAGKVVGVGHGTSGVAVGQSCWNSFAMM